MHVANLAFALNRYSAVAATAMAMGSLVKVTAVGGLRTATKITVAGDITTGLYGFAWKTTTASDEVQTSTVTDPALGSRILTIAAGDDITVLGPTTIIEFDASELDASLDSLRAGTTPAIGDQLGVNLTNSLLAKTDGAGAVIETPIIARVFDVFNSGQKIVVTVL